MLSLSLPWPRRAQPAARSAPDVAAVDPAAALLAEYGLPEHAPAEQLRALTEIAAVLCGVPTAVVNLLDGCFQHQVGAFGFAGAPSPAAESMCALASREPRLRHVPDALDEPALADNPWVDGRLAQVRFYASAPLLLPDGRSLGSLCVFSAQPGALTEAQQSALAALAGQAVALFEHARAARHAEAQAALFRLLAESGADVLSRHRLDGTFTWASPSLRTVLGYDPASAVGEAPDGVHPDDRPLLDDAIRVVGEGGATVATALVRNRHADGSWRWLEIRLAPILGAQSAILELHSVARDVTDRVVAEQQRAESEQRYRALVEHSPDAIVVHVDGRIALANPAAGRLLADGRSERLIGMPIADVTDPAQAAVLRERAADTAAGRDTPVLRTRLRRLDGTWVQVESSGAPIELNGVVGAQNVVRDVTQQEAAREALRLSEQQHRLLFDAGAVGMMESDADGTILRVNAALARLLGHADPADLVGRPRETLLHRDERDAMRSDMTELAAGDADHWTADRVLVRADGQPVEVEIACAVLRAADGSVHRFVASVVDVRERVAARRALEQANRELAEARDDAQRRAALLDAVLETIDVGVVASDADGRLTLFNRATREFHGLPEDPDADPETWAGIYSLFEEDGVTPLVRDRVPLFRALTDGQVHDQHIVIARAGVPARTLQCDGQALRDPLGRPLGAVLAMKDVTESRARSAELAQARDQALAATRAKTAFLAAASHEIRTPLNGVLGVLELLALDGLRPQQAEYVGIARRSGQVLLDLLNDVLDLSKAETTSVVLTAEPFSPADVAADVLAAMTAVASRKGLTLDLHAQDDRLLLGDAARLRQVLMNLIGNAVKFTGSGGIRVDVTVDTATPPGTATAGLSRLRLAVTDTGAGMDGEELSRLFQPFVQGAQGERYGGTGLGLALSQQFVELMGGHLDVTSEPGRGSTFTVDVTLPTARDEQSGPPAVDAAQPGQDTGTAAAAIRVLVADDVEVNRIVAEALLQAHGAVVVTVCDGDEAVEAVRAQPFDLVLLDNRMPRMSGPDAARAIRALPGRAGATRLVALTASTGEQDALACLDAGMDGVLHKPVSGSDLAAALDELRAAARAGC